MSTKIQWTDETWNCITGCSRVSRGCELCYAERQAGTRLKHLSAYDGTTRHTTDGPRWTGQVNLLKDKLVLPICWRAPRRIFVNSMSDWCHENVPFEFMAAMLGVAAACPRHTFQFLTKRPARMRDFFDWLAQKNDARAFACAQPIRACCGYLHRQLGMLLNSRLMPGFVNWPLPNVLLGVSVEDQATADERIPILLHTPAAIRWVSYEPAIGPVDFRRIDMRDLPGGRTSGRDVLDGVNWVCSDQGECAEDTERLNWVVVGGESGPGARRFNLQWARDIVQACQESSVACFVKQLGAKPFLVGPTGHHIKVDVHHSHGADPNEWPEDLCVRQYPTSSEAA